MEKNHKIIIVGLIIVIIALIAGLVYMIAGSNLSFGEGTVPEGMQMYDFDSAFKMAVPKDVRFLKEFESPVDDFGIGTSYFDKNNKMAVSYINSPMLTHELIQKNLEILNRSGNITFEHDGDFIIYHNLKNNGKMGKTFEDSNFTESIAIQRGHEGIIIHGNDLEQLMVMAKTIVWYE